MGSLAIGGTLITTYSLSAWNIRVAVLLLMWSLEPLGGLLSLRIISIRDDEVTSSVQLQYLNTAG